MSNEVYSVRGGGAVIYNVRGQPIEGIYQTRFGRPDGNCHNAALATLLGVPLSELPDTPASALEYLAVLEEWLRPRMCLATLRIQSPTSSNPWSLNNIVHLASGGGPRGCRHTIVMYNGELLWDPHPDGGKLEVYDIDTHWYYVAVGGVTLT